MLKTKKGKELIALMPKRRILTETDGPFAKSNGQMLMPWGVEYTFPELSKIWGVTDFDAKQQVNQNLKTLLSDT